VVYGGAYWKSSQSNNDEVKHFGSGAQGKGLSLQGFPFTGLKVFVGRPDYRIDRRTIKRGFRLGTLITPS
jgi:hypothetical protein